MSSAPKAGIFLSALIVAVGGIIYELIIGTVSSYLLGNSVLQFSLTIGLFLFGMGLGSFIAPYFKNPPEEKLIIVESAVALIGGNAPLLLFSAFAFTPFFHLVFVLTVLAIGILIGFEIPTLLQVVSGKQSTINLVSRILALDYLGALVASILFPLVLLPYLGIVRTAYLVGLANLGIAILMFLAFRSSVTMSRVKLSVGLGLSLVILALGLGYANRLAWFLDHKLYQDEVIYSEQSPYQKIILTKYNDDLRLFLDGSIQFSSIDEYRYHESLVHIPAGMARQRRNILLLGGGDGLAVREILKYPEVEKIQLVDLDERMTRLALTYPLLTDLNENALTNPKVKVINDDALKFLEKSSELFDLILIDLPDPNNEGLAKLYSREFYRLISRHLSEDGLFVTQATSPYFSTKTFSLIKNTIEAEDLHTLPYHVNVPSFGEWGFILGSKQPIDKTRIKLDAETRFLNEEIIPALFIFDKDLVLPEEYSEVNTFYNPIILKTYDEDARRWQP